MANTKASALKHPLLFSPGYLQPVISLQAWEGFKRSLIILFFPMG